MNAASAVVQIFEMLVMLSVIGIFSHYLLERERIKARVDYESNMLKGLKWEPPAPTLAPGTSIIHVADNYAIGCDFNITNGPERKLIRAGIVMDKPTRDTVLVKWTYPAPEDEAKS